jgi:hypothetical protein
MSNISALNLAVSGTCGISGGVSLSSPLISGSSCSYQGITTSTLTTTGAVLHNSLPICNILPSLPNQLVSKGYTDTQNNAQSTLIRDLEIRATAIEDLNLVQEDRLIAIEELNIIQDTRLTDVENTNALQDISISDIEFVNINQDARLDGIDTINTTQNTNITALQTRATAIEGVNTTQNTNITALQTRATAIEGVNTTQNTNITALQTRATTIEGVNTTQNTNITALQTRATTIEGVNTTQNTNITALQTRATSIEGVNTTQNTNITALQTRATSIEGVNTTQGTNITALQTRATAIEGVNTTQGTNITALQQKTTPIVYTTPVAGALTSLTSSLDILPYVSSTFLKVYNINNQAITCLGQAIFGGLGLITSRLQLGNFGTIMTGMSFGNTLSVVGNNVVNFPASSFSGAVVPRVLISPSGNGVFFVVSRTLTSFTYSASVAGVNVDWIALQSV